MKNITTQNPVFSGNVGIGTTNPGRQLEVVGGSGLAIADFKSNSHQADSFLYITNTATPVATEVGSSATLSLSLHNQSGGKISAISTSDYTTNGNSNCALGFSTAFGNSSIERMRITSAGNVGIGTTNPVSKLTISETGSAVNIDPEGSDATSYIGFRANVSAFVGYDYDNASAVLQSGAGKSLRLNTGNATFGSGTALTIDPNGNVGIGTTNPSEKLDVRGSINLRSGYNLTWDGNGLIAANATNMQFYVAGGELMRITSAGNVGIGTTNPAQKLEVNGHAKVQYTLFANYGQFNTTALFGNLSPSSDVQTNANKELISTSDKRLKNDLGDCEYGLSEILQVQPKRYTWKEGPEDQQPTVGFFAQDVHPIMPEAAPREAIQNENGEDDYRWGFHSQTIIAALVNATKEQQSIIEDLKSRIETLEQ
jgi:hypothetical protein